MNQYSVRLYAVDTQFEIHVLVSAGDAPNALVAAQGYADELRVIRQLGPTSWQYCSLLADNPVLVTSGS